MTDFRDHLTLYIPELRRYAFALINHKETADDLVQDSLERAINKSHLWAADKPLKPWLFSIMHNIYVNNIRRYKKAPLFSSVHQLFSHEHPSEEIKEPLSDLKRCLDLLSTEHKEILLLIGLEEMSYTEVAEILAIPVGTVMSRIARARKKLKDLMSDSTEPLMRRVK